jgi:hypothetical protein
MPWRAAGRIGPHAVMTLALPGRIPPVARARVTVQLASSRPTRPPLFAIAGATDRQLESVGVVVLVHRARRAAAGRTRARTSAWIGEAGAAAVLSMGLALRHRPCGCPRADVPL